MKLEVAEKPLTEFVMALGKVFSKPKQVGICSQNGKLIFYTIQDSHHVSVSFDFVCDDFNTAVEASKFSAAVKQLYCETANVEFHPKKMRLVYGNAKVDFPYQTLDSAWSDVIAEVVPLEDGVLDALARTSFVPDTDQRFSGILADPVADGSVIGRFSTTAISLKKLPLVLADRLVLCGTFAKLAKTKIDFHSMLISSNQFGLLSETGVKVLSAQMSDSYPPKYLESFDLNSSGTLIDALKFDFCYKFDAAELKSTVSLVSSIVGDDEQRLVFTLQGTEAKTGALVFSVYSKSYKNIKAEEQIPAEGVVKSEPKPFKVHTKTFAKALAEYSGHVMLFDHKNSVYLSDLDGNSVSVLSKLG